MSELFYSIEEQDCLVVSECGCTRKNVLRIDNTRLHEKILRIPLTSVRGMNWNTVNLPYIEEN